MVDLFAENQRTVEKMRTELSIGAQLVQKFQDEKVSLMKEVERLSQQNMAMQESENQADRIHDLFKPLAARLISQGGGHYRSQR